MAPDIRADTITAASICSIMPIEVFLTLSHRIQAPFSSKFLYSVWKVTMKTLVRGDVVSLISFDMNSFTVESRCVINTINVTQLILIKTRKLCNCLKNQQHKFPLFDTSRGDWLQMITNESTPFLSYTLFSPIIFSSWNDYIVRRFPELSAMKVSLHHAKVGRL